MSLGGSEVDALQDALGSEYEIVRLLGRGGMGSVYLAHEHSLDREVAIKVLRTSAVNDDLRERFLREARTAARLTHPHIVPLHSFGQAGDILYYVMGYVDGESLEALLARAERLDPDEVRRLLHELADALGYAHRQGVIHRDIKPDNVLIERGTGRAVLTDFGIAKLQHARSSLTATGMIVGTPHYMSPEQAAGDRALDGRSDVYSLGVLGYRMLTGQLPFDAPNVQALLAQHVTRQPAAVSSLAPGTPDVLSDVLMRCLAKSPEDRWRDAGAMRAALEESSTSGWTVPEAVEHLPGHGVWLGTGLLGVLLALELLYLATSDGSWLRVALGMPVLFALALLPTLLVARRERIPAGRAWSMLFAPPRRWSGWWPRALRRPGDVWSRLPAIVRRARVVTSLAAAGELLFALPAGLFWLVRAGGNSDPGVLLRALMAAAGVAVAVFGVMLYEGVRVSRWLRAAGLDRRATARMLAEGTWNSGFWRRPEIALLLAPSAGMPLPPVHAPGPGELARAIVALADEVRPIDASLAAIARDTGLALARAVTTLDDEVRAAARDVDAGELARLEQRLATFGGDGMGSSGPQRQMRTLVEEQITLLRELAARHAALVARRDVICEHMRTMWLHLANLRAGHALRDSAAPPHDAVREIVADIDFLTSAVREAELFTNFRGDRNSGTLPGVS